jgi:hypothetical protein
VCSKSINCSVLFPSVALIFSGNSSDFLQRPFSLRQRPLVLFFLIKICNLEICSSPELVGTHVEVLEQEAASLFPLLPHVELGVLEVAVLECLQCDAPLPTSLAAVRSL